MKPATLNGQQTPRDIPEEHSTWTSRILGVLRDTGKKKRRNLDDRGDD
jgi:hypothetical protein